MHLQTYVSAQRGRAVELANAIGVHAVLVRQWASGIRKVPLDHCAAIEQASSGAVRRWDLRPDDWNRIWPELVGSPGAPYVEGAERAAHPASVEPHERDSGWGQLGGLRETDHTELPTPINGNGPEARELAAAIGALTGDIPRREGKG